MEYLITFYAAGKKLGRKVIRAHSMALALEVAKVEMKARGAASATTQQVRR